jgi:hypothetical protein
VHKVAASVLLLAASLFMASPALAEVSDLRPAALTTADAPAGYTHPHLKVYSHFLRKMTIKTRNTGGLKGTSTSSCNVAKSFQADGFQSGMIEVFRTKAFLEALQLCGYLFTGDTGAHTAFSSESARLQKQATKNGYTPLAGATVGDESIGMTATSQGLSVYVIIFRHANALIEIAYIGPSTYAADQFVQAATGSNSRLP